LTRIGDADSRATNETHSLGPKRSRYVVAVDVEMLVPVDDPGEPCYEAETVNLLREIKERPDAGDLAWLRRHGKVYEAV
jgi:hypothetical protein